MRSILFSIGPLHVYGYGFMIAIGVIGAFAIGCFLAKRSGLDDDALFSMGLVGIVGGIIGAKLLYYIVEFPSVLADPSILLNFGEGFVVYGGLIAGFLSPLIYTKAKKLPFLPYLDCAVPGVAFAQGCGRIGCFLAGCCYGRETSAWYGVTFPADSLAPAGVALIPTQLISAAGDFVFALILFALQRKLYHKYEQVTTTKTAAKQIVTTKAATKQTATAKETAKAADEQGSGAVTAVYLMLYAIGRFAIEFLRNDPRGSVGVLSTSQFIAIFMFAAGAVLLGVSMKKRRA